LPDALRSPLFEAYRKRQLFSANMIRPCPLIDAPDSLADIVAESGVKLTDRSKTDASQMAETLKPYASKWKDRTDRLWEQRRHARCASGSAEDTL